MMNPVGFLNPGTLSVGRGPQALKTAAREFEAVLLQMLLRQARPAAEGSFAGGVFQDWQNGLLAESMSAAGGIGLSQLLYQQWMQERIDPHVGHQANHADHPAPPANAPGGSHY